jgi:hypothetical protein
VVRLSAEEREPCLCVKLAIDPRPILAIAVRLCRCLRCFISARCSLTVILRRHVSRDLFDRNDAGLRFGRYRHRLVPPRGQRCGAGQIGNTPGLVFQDPAHQLRSLCLFAHSYGRNALVFYRQNRLFDRRYGNGADKAA